ncbi:MAG: DUF4838 domain-containing protein [Candidatus Sumerlaeaceae bacterium]
MFLQQRLPYLVIGMVALCAIAQAEWRNALVSLAEPSDPVTLVSRAKPAGHIQLPPRPTPQERKAAADLQHWIAQITSATLPIKKSARGAVVSIRTDDACNDEEYRIQVDGRRILLYGGRTRGVVNAVYALLEEDMGCRFYTNESIRLPTTSTLVARPVPRRYGPRLKLRDPFYYCAFDPVWSLRNRTNAPDAKVPEAHGGHVDYDNMFVHTMDKLVSATVYFKKHPEYFALQPDGSRNPIALCATEPKVAKIAIKAVRDILRRNPNTEIISVSKNDTTVVCHCERCKKLRDAEGSDIANQLVLVNKIADAIAADYPRVTIDTLAYLETIQVPKTVRPRKNVAIRLCNDAVGAWTYPFRPAEQCDIAKLASAWAAVHHRIYIWDYNVNFSHYLAPMPNLDIMAANIRFWIRNNAEGVMLQGGYQGAAEQDHMKCWVTAKLMWDASWDEKELVHDFIWGHYASAAPAMQEYDDLLQQMRVEHKPTMDKPAQGIRYPMDAPFITRDFITSASALFSRARELAGGDTALLQRIERAELPILYVQCERGAEFTGPEYAAVVDRFALVARREKVNTTREGPTDLDAKIAGYHAKVRK